MTRKENNEEVVINQADFDSELYELVDKKSKAEVERTKQEADDLTSAQKKNAEAIEKNAGVRNAGTTKASKKPAQ
ncbi:MAG: hypothetical protein ABI639_17605 [Thermoanaerobaculia bacterium]